MSSNASVGKSVNGVISSGGFSELSPVEQVVFDALCSRMGIWMYVGELVAAKLQIGRRTLFTESIRNALDRLQRRGLIRVAYGEGQIESAAAVSPSSIPHQAGTEPAAASFSSNPPADQAHQLRIDAAAEKNPHSSNAKPRFLPPLASESSETPDAAKAVLERLAVVVENFCWLMTSDETDFSQEVCNYAGFKAVLVVLREYEDIVGNQGIASCPPLPPPSPGPLAGAEEGGESHAV